MAGLLSPIRQDPAGTRSGDASLALRTWRALYCRYFNEYCNALRCVRASRTAPIVSAPIRSVIATSAAISADADDLEMTRLAALDVSEAEASAPHRIAQEARLAREYALSLLSPRYLAPHRRRLAEQLASFARV